MKALVTGGGGFLGRYIVEKLQARGDTAKILARGSYPDLESTGVECFRGDLQKYDDVKAACEDVDIVFHVAALAGAWGKYEDFHGVNVKGTENIIKACKEHGIKKLVYTSSPSVVFDMGDLEGVNETQPYPKSFSAFYPQTKAEAEKIVLKADSNELATCSLRPHLIWGPRDNHILPMLIKKAKGEGLIQVGDGKNVVDFCYVENAADAHILAADHLEPGSALSGKAYFISDDDPQNLWDWVKDFLKRMDLPPVKKTISEKKAMRIASILEFVHRTLPFLGEPRITKFIASNFATSHYFDISNAKKDFAYVAKVSNEEGMQRSIEWLKKNL